VEKDNKNPKLMPINSAAVRNSEIDPEIIDREMMDPEIKDMYRRLEPAMRRPRPSPEAVAAAMEAAQRLAAEADAEDAAGDTGHDTPAEIAVPCAVCGYRNRAGTKFCGRCGVPVADQPIAGETRSAAPPQASASSREMHHYHHHYHHHYFPGGGVQEPGYSRPAMEPVREEKFRPSAALRGDMSRAEAAVRRVTQEWVLACNTKHLDDLLELYGADALVLRSNYPPIRGAAAVREFFFGALDAGLGEVELEPLRVDVVGDMAYEAGRFKALIPSSTGKRREERGKYLWVCARQSNGEWKLAADSWSSDLTFGTLEADVPQTSGVKTITKKNL